MPIRLLNATAVSQGTIERNFVRPGSPAVEVLHDVLVAAGGRHLDNQRELVVGGVHRRDGSVVTSTLLHRAGEVVMVARAPEEIVAQPAERRLAEAAYGGILIHHFGHFTLESTARLWWILESGYRGPILFQSTTSDPLRRSYVAEFFRLLGLADRIVIAEPTLRVDTLHVPAPAIEIRGFVHESFALPFRAIGERALAEAPDAGSTGRLYLSRTQLSNGLAIGETAIEARLREDGYRIVHPETMPLGEQIALLDRADRIVGLVGSAFHNLLYCRAKTVCYLGRTDTINENFPMIDQLLGTDALYIMGRRRPRQRGGNGRVYMLSPNSIAESLTAEGWLGPRQSQASGLGNIQRQVLAEVELQAGLRSASRETGELPGEEALQALLIAAALRPGDRRTLKALVAAMVTKRRFRIAEQFAREFIKKCDWNERDAQHVAALFAAAGKNGLASGLLSWAARRRQEDGGAPAAGPGSRGEREPALSQRAKLARVTPAA